MDYSWDYVASLFWSRYPNPFSKHVLHEDTLERTLLDSNTLYTKRVIMKQGFGRIPFWLRKVLSNRQELMVEESIVDISARRITTITRNVGALARHAVVEERCEYFPLVRRPETSSSPQDCTQIERCLSAKSSLAAKVLYPLWAFLKMRYASSAEKSLLGFNHVCQMHSQNPSAVTTVATVHPSSLRDTARSHIKELARTKRPRVVIAETERSN
ncbi:hypothetical protein AAHC03_0266 [Spirometra sp. Aus1]|nr:unnamed protein product [Spirometra erinaceieuropaei]